MHAPSEVFAAALPRFVRTTCVTIRTHAECHAGHTTHTRNCWCPPFVGCLRVCAFPRGPIVHQQSTHVPISEPLCSITVWHCELWVNIDMLCVSGRHTQPCDECLCCGTAHSNIVPVRVAPRTRLRTPIPTPELHGQHVEYC